MKPLTTLAATAIAASLAFGARAEPPKNEVLYEHSFCAATAQAFTGAIVMHGGKLNTDETAALSAAIRNRGEALNRFFQRVSENMRDKAEIEKLKGSLYETLSAAVEEAKPHIRKGMELDITFNVFQDRRHQCREILVMRA